MSKSIKDATKNTNWVYTGEKPTLEQLQLSCLMRIADATELMARDRLQMERDLKWYRQMYAEHQATIERLNHSIAGHKAANTKLRKRLALPPTTQQI